MLEVSGLSSGYGDIGVLRDVSLHVSRGEIVTVIGANGAGKTTLLRTISGLLRPSAGRVLFDAVPIGGMRPDRIVAQGLVHCPEGRGVLKRMSVRENLMLGAYRLGRGDRSAALARIFALFPRLNERQGQAAVLLSGGEQQMLAIGARVDGGTAVIDPRRAIARPVANVGEGDVRYHPATPHTGRHHPAGGAECDAGVAMFGPGLCPGWWGHRCLRSIRRADERPEGPRCLFWNGSCPMIPRIFPPAEFHDRVARLRAALRQVEAEIMYIDESEILAYFTGYETSLNLYRACFIPLHGNPVMVLRALDVAPFRAQAWFNDCVGLADTESPVDAVVAALTFSGFANARIGIDLTSHALSVATFQALQAGLPDASFVAMNGIPRELRLEKSAREVAMIARAAEIADEVVLSIAAQFRPGLNTRDATAMAMHEYGARGADPHYVARISAGRGWDFLHAGASDAPLQTGDILHVEVAPSYGGYSARIMRSIAVGGASAEQADSIARLAALQDAQFAAMRPGVIAGDVDTILREGVLEQHLRESYSNITGYTLGYYAQQPLRSSDFTRVFCAGAQWRLAPGMVFHMYTSAKGVSLSETVVVEADRARRLTQLPRIVLSTAP